MTPSALRVLAAAGCVWPLRFGVPVYAGSRIGYLLNDSHSPATFRFNYGESAIFSTSNPVCSAKGVRISQLGATPQE